MSLAMLVHQQRFKKTAHEFLGTPALVAMSGWISLMIGLLIVVSHNVWVGEWPVVITIVGWLVLLQGLMRIFFPDSFVKMMKDMMAKTGYLLMSWIWLLVGIYLIWAGFSN
jgi:uncharacterized membrane protein YczE